MNIYRHILLDADGTLFDFERAEEEALRQTLRRLQLPFSRAIRLRYQAINQELWEAFEKGQIDKDALKVERFSRLLGALAAPDDPEAVNRVYMSELGRCAFLIDGAEAVCRRLAPRYQLSLITNGIAAVQHARIGSSPLAGLMSGIFISEEIGCQKPQAGFFDYVLEALAIDDKRTALVVGDSLSADMLGGQNAGLDTCWYNPGRKTANPAVPTTYEIFSLEDLVKILS